MKNQAIKELSAEQIAELFRFTEKKRVHWYDLQIELVDHLASRIEEEITADNTLSFKDALNKVYHDFGIFGFAKVVQEKSAALEKNARRTWWKELRLQFQWPALGGWLLLAACLYQLTAVFPVVYLYVGFLLTYAVAAVFNILSASRLLKLKKRLLIVQAGLSYSPVSVWTYGVTIFSISNKTTPMAFCIYAFLGILFQVIAFRVCKGVRKKANDLYPEVFAP